MSMTADQIEAAHIIDDLETRRTAGLRAMVLAVDLVNTAIAALEGGALGVTEEYLDRTKEALADGLRKIALP